MFKIEKISQSSDANKLKSMPNLKVCQLKSMPNTKFKTRFLKNGCA